MVNISKTIRLSKFFQELGITYKYTKVDVAIHPIYGKLLKVYVSKYLDDEQVKYVLSNGYVPVVKGRR